MNLRIEPTKKIYYHNLKYKIVINDEINTDEYYNLIGRDDIWGMRPYAYCAKILKNKDQTQIYADNEIAFNNLRKYFDKRIVHLEKPINSYHSELLEKYDIDIKKTLYYRKYRYKVKFGNLSEGKNKVIDNIQAVVRSNPESFMCMGLHNYSSISYSWIMPTVYIKDKQSLMLLKLSVGEQSQHVNTVITIKEIKNEERIGE